MKLKYYVQAFFTGRFSVLLCALSFTLFLNVQPQAQTVPVGTPFFEDALRRAQLMGRLDPNVSFTIRPVDPVRAFKLDNPFGHDTVLFPLDSNTYSRYTDLKGRLGFAGGMSLNKNVSGKEANLRLTLLPVYLHTRYNHHHPYGWSDGPMVPSKGIQQYISGGFFVKAGPIEAQYRPEYVWSQNNRFQNPPVRNQFIDHPERMGQSNYKKTFLGQSYVKLNLGPISTGFSNENIWWGPGMKNAIIMSNNAPGFGHFTLNTNKPIHTRLGSFEGQLVSAKLKRSGFMYPKNYDGVWPPIAGDVIPDTADRGAFHSYFTGVAITYQPRWTPGLFLGVTRVAQGSGEPESVRDYLSVFNLASKQRIKQEGSEYNKTNRNQIISIFARYLFKEAHAEVYTEIGRDDHWWDLEDLLTRPRHFTVYLAGVRKIYQLSGKDRWLQVSSEYTKIQAPYDNLVRLNFNQMSFYQHSNGVGWTHNGQVLGAGIGPGSNMFNLGLTYGKGFNTYSLQFEHVTYNEDLFYTQIDYLRLGGPSKPFFVDASKHFIDWSVIFSQHTSFGKLMLGYQLQLLRTYNFQWNYDPYGGAGPFRFSGLNIWSLNGEMSLLYRF
jgi:hypothetical protein